MKEIDEIYIHRLRSPELMVVDEQELEEDRAYLRAMYPMCAKMILVMVEDACDRLEYEGSMMYDEYPDRLSLLRKSQEVWEQAQKRENFGENSPDWEQIRDLTGVLLLQEMLVRRKKKRRR